MTAKGAPSPRKRQRTKPQGFVSGRPWTAEEDNIVRAGYAEARRIKEMARELGRSYGAIESRAGIIGARIISNETWHSDRATAGSDALLRAIRNVDPDAGFRQLKQECGERPSFEEQLASLEAKFLRGDPCPIVRNVFWRRAA